MLCHISHRSARRVLRSFTGCKAQTSQLLPWILTLQKMGQSVFSLKTTTLLLPISRSVEIQGRKERWKDVKFIMRRLSEGSKAEMCSCSLLSRLSASTRPSTHRRSLSKRSMPGISSHCLHAARNCLFFHVRAESEGYMSAKQQTLWDPIMWTWCWCRSNCSSLYKKLFYQTLAEHKKRRE